MKHHQFFVSLLTVCALFSECTAAQERQPISRIGVLWPVDASTAAPFHQALQSGLNATGRVEGKNMQLIVRYGDRDASRLSALAAELVDLRVDVLVASAGAGAVHAARRATATLPIVCPDMYDPVEEGLTRSLASPTANVTGVSWQSLDTAAKRLDLTIEMIPGIRRVAVLFDSTDPGAALEARALLAAARKSGITLRTFAVSGVREIQAAMRAIENDRPEAVIVPSNPTTDTHREEIWRLASAQRLPLIGEGRSFAEVGFLLTFGVDILETYKRVGAQVDKILKGATPQDVPIEQPTKFELILNLRSAKALGITIPDGIALRASEVIR